MKSSFSVCVAHLAFLLFTLLATPPVVLASGEDSSPSPAPAPTPTRVQFRPNQVCQCSYKILVDSVVDCNPPSRCSCMTENNDLSTCACGIGDGDPMVRYTCGESDCCVGYGVRRDRSRHLQMVLGNSTDEDVTVMDPSDKVHQELYQSYFEKCRDLNYDISLIVTSHLYVVASPSQSEDPTSAIGCPFLVTHAHFSNTEEASINSEEAGSEVKVATKELLVWYNKEQGEAQFLGEGTWRDKSYFVGQHPLHELAAAYEAVDATGEYDVVTNNCAHYILRLSQQMGISVDAKMTSFVTHRLMAESSNKMMTLMRDRVKDFSASNWFSYYFNSVVSWWRNTIMRSRSDGDTIDAATEEELMEQLVESTIATNV